MTRNARRRESQTQGGRNFPRTARVGALLREVVAEELEKVTDQDERLGLLTVTAVEPDPDFRHATVLLSSVTDEVAEVLETHRYRLQAAIGRQVRLKHTPQLTFEADPAIAAGSKIEAVLQEIHAAAPAVRPNTTGTQEEGGDNDSVD